LHSRASATLGMHIALFNGNTVQGAHAVNCDFTIMVADRNRHVREFLKREFTLLGYEVELARDGWEVLAMTKGNKPPELLILDPEIPFPDGPDIVTQLNERQPSLPILIHTFLPESTGNLIFQSAAGLVEKRGNIEQLKTTVAEILKKWYPHRFASTEKEVQS
jgi:DNA-binding response OmpR family regulator